MISMSITSVVPYKSIEFGDNGAVENDRHAATSASADPNTHLKVRTSIGTTTTPDSTMGDSISIMTAEDIDITTNDGSAGVCVVKWDDRKQANNFSTTYVDFVTSSDNSKRLRGPEGGPEAPSV